MIAALFVERGGVYYGLEGVDPWDIERDARKYAGPWPVVAHPPCSRWCQLAGLVEARYGHKRGDDGGCFESALNAVRTWGGVLEHPAFSHAWPHFGLLTPTPGQWTRSLFDPGWVAQVSQAAYGHQARKLTWLYAVTPSRPPLHWTIPDATHSLTDPKLGRYITHQVSFCGNHGNSHLPRMPKRAASRTPIPFRNLLLSIASSCNNLQHPLALPPLNRYR